MKKTIIYTINSIKKNGPNVVLENMIKGLAEDDCEVYVVSFLDANDSKIVKRFKAYGISHISLDYPNKKEIFKKGVRDLQRTIDTLNPDVVHSHGLFPDYVSSRVVTSAKKITTIHNLPFEDYRSRFGFIAGTLLAKWNISLVKDFDHIVCCSETSYNHLKRHTKSKKISFVRNAINFDEHWDSEKEQAGAKLRKQLGISDADVVYIFVGGLTNGKNVKLLVDGFRRSHLKNEKLIILGEGSELAYCKENKDDSIFLVGFQKDVNKYYFASDIYISASKSEGFSISILEALEAGLYLFLSNIPAHLEVLNINRRMFIGTSFSVTTFDDDLAKFRNKYLKQQKNKDDVIAFKNKYLTAKIMMTQYKKFYLRAR